MKHPKRGSGQGSDQERLYDEALDGWEERCPGDWREAPPVDLFDTAALERLANARMGFGRYAGSLLIDLPESYVLWFSRKGWPNNETGRLLAALYVIKENGMESLLRPLVHPRGRGEF